MGPRCVSGPLRPPATLHLACPVPFTGRLSEAEARTPLSFAASSGAANTGISLLLLSLKSPSQSEDPLVCCQPWGGSNQQKDEGVLKAPFLRHPGLSRRAEARSEGGLPVQQGSISLPAPSCPCLAGGGGGFLPSRWPTCSHCPSEMRLSQLPQALACPASLGFGPQRCGRGRLFQAPGVTASLTSFSITSARLSSP